MFLGLDNVGKTNFILWYLTALSKLHNKKWCIWSGENNAGQLKRDIIQMWTGETIKDLNEYLFYHDEISNYFKFIDNRKLYNHKELLQIFEEEECDGCLIDPYTGINHDRRISQFERNYQICNDVRMEWNLLPTKVKKSIDIHEFCTKRLKNFGFRKLKLHTV